MNKKKKKIGFRVHKLVQTNKHKVLAKLQKAYGESELEIASPHRLEAQAFQVHQP